MGGCTCRAGRRGDGQGDGMQMSVRQRKEGGEGAGSSKGGQKPPPGQDSEVRMGG